MTHPCRPCDKPRDACRDCTAPLEWAILPGPGTPGERVVRRFRSPAAAQAWLAVIGLPDPPAGPAVALPPALSEDAPALAGLSPCLT